MADTVKIAPLSALEYLATTFKGKLDDKVDTREGYDLSSNDYTDDDKAVVDNIECVTDPEGEDLVDEWFEGYGSGSGSSGSNAELEAQIASLQSQLETAQFQLTTAQSQLSTKDSTISSLQGQLDSKSAQLTTAQTSLAEKTEAYNTLAAEKTEMETYYAGLADQLEAIIGSSGQAS